MTRKFLPFQEHSSERIFAKLHPRNVRELARTQERLSSDLRLYLIGLGRVTNRGHAAFHRGELASLIGTEDRNLRKVIKKLVLSEALSPQSSVRCLVYPRELVTLTILRGSDSCPEHGTHRSWSNKFNDWVDDYPTVVPVSEESVEASADVEELNGPFEESENQFMGTFSS